MTLKLRTTPMVLLVFSLFFSFSIEGQTEKIDSTAIYLLDKMSNIIGDLESVTYQVKTSYDRLNHNNNIETHFSTSEVNMVGPDKLSARINSDKGGHSLSYDGEHVSYYSFGENNYVTLEAPDNIISMIDDMHQRFDFKFPAADFFYPSFTDDILDQFDTIKYLGKKMVDGIECFHIMALNKDTNVQIWIMNKTQLLPKQLMLIYKNKNNMQYRTTFTNWELNPNIPASIFDFLPPPKATLISILEKESNN